MLSYNNNNNKIFCCTLQLPRRIISKNSSPLFFDSFDKKTFVMEYSFSKAAQAALLKYTPSRILILLL